MTRSVLEEAGVVLGVVVAGPDVELTGTLVVGRDVLGGGPALREDEVQPVALKRAGMVEHTHTPTTVRLTASVFLSARVAPIEPKIPIQFSHARQVRGVPASGEARNRMTATRQSPQHA